MKKIGILLSSFFYFSFCIAQRDSLYALEKAIKKGDETALRQLAMYLDSPHVIRDPMGYHQLEHSEKSSPDACSAKTAFSYPLNYRLIVR